MKKIIKAVLCLFLSIITLSSVFGQIQIYFQPSVYGKTLDGIFFFQANNQANTTFRSKVKITVTEERTGKVAEIATPSVMIQNGLNSFNRTLLGNAVIKFNSNVIASIFRQTGKLPEGEYEYCFELIPLDSKPGLSDSYETCFQLSLQPLTPLLLVEPGDGENLCNKRPDFLWQSPVPVDFNARYRLVVVEVKEKQPAVEALSFNIPVINVGELRMSRCNFPSSLKDLEKGKTYAWQISYSVNNMLISKSEIWTFKIDCDEENLGTTDDSYRELKTYVEGDFYIATRQLKFAVNNEYNGGDLDYKIVNLKEADKPVSNLPILKILPGLNKYNLNLSEYRGFNSGEQYQLEVRLANGQKFYLRFTYKD